MLNIFDEAQWRRVEDTYEAWWQRKIDRPVLHLTFGGADPGMRPPYGLVTGDLFRYSPGEPAELIAEKIEYIMRSMRYEYDAFPYIYMYFGPIYEVEFFGARAYIDDSTVWFRTENAPPIREMHVTAIDKNSLFYPSYRKIAKACEERFGSGYAITPPLAGGCCLDYVAEFYKPTDLSYMLYDEPDEVNRLSMEFHKASFAVGRELTALTPSARGYTYEGMFAPVPWKLMQCDYSAMIGPEHFERFVKWDIELSVSESPRHNFYHLDGPGAVIHLDTILSIPDLKCVQWVPGIGEKPAAAWPEVYKKISGAGKNIWLFNELEDVEKIADQIGTAKGLYWKGCYPLSEYDRVMKIAERLMA
ncbi:MAG: hypothetical protein FWD23_16730 [Oscillospiraceae bacterium]|nr:hypothetical protein [Oscillospiraceae bacterium]